MFYIRSMRDESRESGVSAPEGFSAAVLEPLRFAEGGGGVHPPLKRIDAVEFAAREKTEKQLCTVEFARKRGGQPGNRNAFRTGLHTAEVRRFHRRIRAWHERTRLLLAWTELVIAARRRS